MLLISLLVYSFLSGSPSGTLKRKKYRAPSFDYTGVSYRLPLTSILEPAISAEDMYWWLPYTNGDSLQFVAANHVKTMRCYSYEPDDTTTYYSENEKREITVHHIGGMHKWMRWDFDTSGRITAFVCYNDTMEEGIRSSRYFTYDEQGYVTATSTYSLQDGISKQYRGYTARSGTRYKWSKDHRQCDVSYNSSLVSLPGTSRSYRKAWDGHESYDEHWEFNAQGQSSYFKGDNFGHSCEIRYTYNGKGDLATRQVKILDKCGGAFADSIAWIYSSGSRVAQHYFRVNFDGAYQLLEIVGYDQHGQVVMTQLENDTEFPDDEFKQLRGRKFVATYTGTTLSGREESDSLGNPVVWQTFYTEDYKNQKVTTSTWMDTDTSRGDTIRVIKTYTMQNGLVRAIDVHNIDWVWWRGTWFFPEYYNLDYFECYRFRYEFYN